MAANGLGFAGREGFWPLLVIAFIGSLNSSSGNVSVFLPLGHTVIAHIVADENAQRCSPATASSERLSLALPDLCLLLTSDIGRNRAILGRMVPLCSLKVGRVALARLSPWNPRGHVQCLAPK
jgi:hypothetical protein